MKQALRRAAVLVSGLALLTVAALAMVAVRVALLGGGRRFCQERIGGWAGEALLAMLGLRLRVHREGDWPTGPCFYMCNHSSSLDLPVLMALRLPNARTFIKERFAWYGPLGVVLLLTGTFFTAPQEQHARRVARFKRAEAVLRRTGESVFGTPEGTRVLGGTVGPFNRGVFHIATKLHLPIVPMLIVIPPEIDPGRDITPGAGLIEVYVGQTIDTSTWTPEDLDHNKDAVRELFLDWQQRMRA